MAVWFDLARTEVALAALATVTVLLLTWYLKGRNSQSQRRNLPPGPKGWPILGSLPLLSALPHHDLFELSKQYGPLMMMKLGSVKALVVTSPKFAEAILKTYDTTFASRPQLIVAREMSYNFKEVAWQAYGQRWRNVRKMCTVGLLAANRLSEFKDVRKKEVMDALHFVLQESKRGNAVNMAECFSTITMNNITQMIFGQRFCSSGPSSGVSEKYSWLPEALQELFVTIGSVNISDLVPLLKPFDLQGFHKRVTIVMRKLDGFLEETIAERRLLKSSKSSEIAEDFTNTLLNFTEKNEHGECLSIEEVKANLLDMLAAGGDAPAATCLWALAELLKHPKAMRKLQGELDSVVGSNRLVQEDDLPKLPYLNAVVKETFRFHPIGPLLVPHESVKDCEIEGFHIPAKTRIFVNVWGIQRDPAVWERPLEFNPERFLNSTKDVRGQDFDLLPFGSGRRMCAGMNLGIIMAMYPVALLVHAIDWRLPEGHKPEEIDMGELFGLVLYKEQPLRVFGKGRLPDHVLYPL